MPVADAVGKIIQVTGAQGRFWDLSSGWAPAAAAVLLSKSRLDRQHALAQTLQDYLTPPKQGEQEARLILGYVTLRAMCEGTIKLVFSVWYQDYLKDADALKQKGKTIDPDGANFDPLILLFEKKFSSRWTPFFRRVQARGNAIHAFKDRPLGTFAELHSAIVEYKEFLLEADGLLPYPDDDFASSRA